MSTQLSKDDIAAIVQAVMATMSSVKTVDPAKSDVQNRIDADPRETIKVYNEKAGPASWFETPKEHFYGVLYNTTHYVELTPEQEEEFKTPKVTPPPGKPKPIAGEDTSYMGTIKKLSKT